MIDSMLPLPACHLSVAPSAFQKPSAPSATAALGAIDRPRRFRLSSKARQPWALSRVPSVKPINSFLPSGVAPMMTRMHCVILQTRLQMNAVGPDVDVVFGCRFRAPALVFVDPDVLQPRSGRGRQARSPLAEQGGQRLREVTSRDALSSRGSGSAYRGSSSAGRCEAHDLALGQMAGTHNAPTAVRGLDIGGPGQKVGTRNIARSMEKCRLEHPHDMPPSPIQLSAIAQLESSTYPVCRQRVIPTPDHEPLAPHDERLSFGEP